MKFSILIILLFSSLINLAQNNQVTIVLSTSVDSYMAIRSASDELIIDDNFNLKDLEFSEKYREQLSNYPSISEIFNKTLTELKTIEKVINEQKFCDYLNPIIAIHQSDSELTKIEWNRIENCYPEIAMIVGQINVELERLAKKYAP